MRSAGIEATGSARALGIASAVAIAATACRAPAPNPDVPRLAVAPIAKVEEQPGDVASDPTQADATTAAPDPLRPASFPPDAELQPITFDLSGESSWDSATSELRSPLWMPRARRADGAWPTPPGRVQKERLVAAFVISLAVIATAPWTIGKIDD